MSSTLTSFDDEYYEYHGGEREERGFGIGGYELAFLADLVASYIFDISKALLNPKTYQSIYQYDSLVVFKVKKSVK